MRGDLYTGWVKLAGDFPPSVNTADDVTALKPYESPACYGVDCRRDGQLKTGSIISGTTRVATAKTISNVAYVWHYDRIWRANGADLIHGAKFYDKVYAPQGRGKVTAEATIVGFQPCLRNRMWIYGGSGSQFIGGADSASGQFALDQLIQEMVVTTNHATSAVTLDEIPYCVNTQGIWSYDGTAVKELTRPVRYSLGSFASEVALTCDYQQKFIIGAAKFVVDATNGKLFDYGSTGFLFTTRTLTAADNRPFAIGDIGFSIEFGSASDASISWESKTEDDDWVKEDDITVPCDIGTKSFITTRMADPKTARKFAIRLTAISDHLYIRSINMNLANFATGDFGA